jgi:hypothetical protein
MAMVLGRSLLFTVLLSACASPARAAEPLLMFLFGVAKEIASTSAGPYSPVPAQAEEPVSYPGTTVQPARLRRLIDESFTYLSEAQRGEIFTALHAELMKPGNVAISAPMIEHFAHRAFQVRAAQQHLARLSSREKESLAHEFRAEVKSLGAEEVGHLRLALERGLLPVPSDLNQLFLAAFDLD